MPSPYCNENWDYGCQGREWECKCNEGSMQSPIDLPKVALATEATGAAMFDYKRSPKEKTRFVWEEGKVKMKGVFGTLTDTDMAEYEAFEIQFHTPAEHTLNGKSFDLELQIHHRPLTEGDFAKKAVLSILFDKVPGASNKFFEKIDITMLPDKFRKERDLDEDVVIADIFEDVAGMSITHFDYFYYHGSQTAPPCDEQVQWFIVAEPLQLGNTVIDMVRDVINIKVSTINPSFVLGFS